MRRRRARVRDIHQLLREKDHLQQLQIDREVQGQQVCLHTQDKVR